MVQAGKIKSLLMRAVINFEGSLYDLDTELSNHPEMPTKKAHTLLQEHFKRKQILCGLLSIHQKLKKKGRVTEMEIELAEDLLKHSERVITSGFNSNEVI